MIRTEFMTWDEAQAALVPEWRALVRAGGFNPSLDPAWMDAALRSHRLERDALVTVARAGSRLVGVLPLVCTQARIRGLPMRTVDLASNVVSYHPELVATEGHEALISAGLARAHGGRWDLFRANALPVEGPSLGHLRTVLARDASCVFEDPSENSPYIRIDSGWDDYLKSRSKKFRANLLRTTRRSQDMGEAVMQWHVGATDYPALLADIAYVEDRSWKARAGTAITSRPFEVAYHERLLPVLGQLNALFANVLHVDGRPAAYVLACSHGGWVGQLKTSYDAALQDAGARAIDESVHRAFESGAREYDFLGDAAPHKTKWTELSRAHVSLTACSRRVLPTALGLAKRITRWRRRRSSHS